MPNDALQTTLTRHERNCAFVTEDGPAPCTCGWWEREEKARRESQKGKPANDK